VSIPDDAPSFACAWCWVVSLGSACSSKGTGEGAYATEPRGGHARSNRRRAATRARVRLLSASHEVAVSLDVGTPEMVQHLVAWHAGSGHGRSRPRIASTTRSGFAMSPASAMPRWATPSGAWSRGIFSGFESRDGHRARGARWRCHVRTDRRLQTTRRGSRCCTSRAHAISDRAVGTGARWRSQQAIKGADGTSGIDEREYEARVDRRRTP